MKAWGEIETTKTLQDVHVIDRWPMVKDASNYHLEWHFHHFFLFGSDLGRFDGGEGFGSA